MTYCFDCKLPGGDIAPDRSRRRHNRDNGFAAFVRVFLSRRWEYSRDIDFAREDRERDELATPRRPFRLFETRGRFPDLERL